MVRAGARKCAEARERERLAHDTHNFVRKAAEVHRRVRRYAQMELLVPGARLIDICEKLENATRTYLEADKSPLAGLRAVPPHRSSSCFRREVLTVMRDGARGEQGIGFPTGVSLNNVAAHYTSNPGDTTVLRWVRTSHSSLYACDYIHRLFSFAFGVTRLFAGAKMCSSSTSGHT